MSHASPRIAPQEATASEDGRRARAHASSSDDDTRSAEAARAIKDDADARAPTPKQLQGRLRGGAGQQYRQLFNSVIEDACGQSSDTLHPLAPSLIGASNWTSNEKATFFTALAKHGLGDLRTVSRVVGSKTESEIQVYLGLLQDGAVEASATLSAQNWPSSAEVPIAVEIGVDCEVSLDHAAVTLGRKLDQRDIKAAKEELGDDWLIDEAYAAKTEQRYAQFEKSQHERSNEDATPEDSTRKPDVVPSEAVGLLRSEAFLQLSRNLFMNGTAVSEHTWHELVALPDNLGTEPAIFRSAFDGLYNLAVSLTRRLVQATLFQTISRLRANDASRANWRPKVEVQEVDVRTALDVLDMDTDAMAYWAKLPRRCGVDVYSDSKKYKDGRPGAKTGVKLTYDEVEAELGIPGDQKAVESHEHASGVLAEEAVVGLDTDSDMFTLVSDTDQDEEAWPDEQPRRAGAKADAAKDGDESLYTKSEHESVSEAASLGTQDDTAPVKEENDGLRMSRKRKRALSPASFARAECLHLELLDRQASMEEERQLWEMLRQEPPQERKFYSATEVAALASGTGEAVLHWRSKVRYEAMWERFPNGVAAGEFAEMEQHGRVGRKRRALARGDEPSNAGTFETNSDSVSSDRLT
ncbi:hypothetical protein LTR08_000063 [Meristemomyces frigidus]|nr:hypothetical protein LTR08_000063 [Meristemomyces frigidus]